MSRVGLGRHGQLDSDAGDPLDGLVNLFDVGIVLAVGFLVAGLSLSLDHHKQKSPPPGTTTTPLSAPSKRQATGPGQAVGQVFRLPDGRLVLVGAGSRGTSAP
jgi:hypothetical protein